jgi:hypothetical protein
MAFRKAKPQQAYVKAAIYGEAGSGKTTLALLAAEGLAQLSGKRIAFIDTEHGTDFYVTDNPSRRWHPKAFDIDCLYSRSITEVNKDLQSLSDNEHGVVVVDSITHLWESTMNAYSGKRTSLGGIPIDAWNRVKQPYKILMNWLVNAPFHIVVCGREGNVFDESDNGRLEKVGTKMRAEGETAYEFHVVIRAFKERHKKGPDTHYAHVLKDRTSMLSGQVIEWPDYQKLITPLLPLLGTEQAVIPTDDEVGNRDAEAIAKSEREKAASSAEALRQFQAKFQLAKTSQEVEAVSKEITPAVKRGMFNDHVASLRDAYSEALRRVTGQANSSGQEGGAA